MPGRLEAGAGPLLGRCKAGKEFHASPPGWLPGLQPELYDPEASPASSVTLPTYAAAESAQIPFHAHRVWSHR